MSSDLFVMIVGVVVFALTVYGTLMAGGIALSRRQLEEDDLLMKEVDPDELGRRVPTGVKY
jgi:hypothetical protein